MEAVMGNVCGVKWCLAETRDEQPCCAVHAKLPVIDGETMEQWMRRAPIRAKRAVIAAAVLKSVQSGNATTAEISRETSYPPSAVRLALKALRNRAEVQKTGWGRSIKYKALDKVA
jgi:hypothetical protein